MIGVSRDLVVLPPRESETPLQIEIAFINVNASYESITSPFSKFFLCLLLLKHNKPKTALMPPQYFGVANSHPSHQNELFRCGIANEKEDRILNDQDLRDTLLLLSTLRKKD